MKLTKRTAALGLVAIFVTAGTALAAVRLTTTTESVTLGSPSGSAVTVSKTTTDAVVDNRRPNANTVVITQTSPEAELANVLLRVLGIPVSVQQVTVLQSRNLGYGEIALLYNLSQASGRPIDDILVMRLDRKMGWGRIAKSLGVKLHGAADQSMVILREAKLDRAADDFNILIKVDLDDDDRDDYRDDNKDKKSEHEHLKKFSKDNDDNPGKGKGHNKH